MELQHSTDLGHLILNVRMTGRNKPEKLTVTVSNKVCIYIYIHMEIEQSLSEVND